MSDLASSHHVLKSKGRIKPKNDKPGFCATITKPGFDILATEPRAVLLARGIYHFVVTEERKPRHRQRSADLRRARRMLRQLLPEARKHRLSLARASAR